MTRWQIVPSHFKSIWLRMAAEDGLTGRLLRIDHNARDPNYAPIFLGGVRLGVLTSIEQANHIMNLIRRDGAALVWC